MKTEDKPQAKVSVKDLESDLAHFESKHIKRNSPETNTSADNASPSEKRSRTWLENSPVCTKIMDADFNLQYMSGAGIGALKIENIEDYYGKPYPFSFFPEYAKTEVTQLLEKVKSTGEVITAETPVFDIDGKELFFQSTFTRVNHDNGNFHYIMGVSTEITARKKAEEKLKSTIQELHKTNNELIKSKEKAEESEKLKSAFLANMSHEIRTPLNSILGFTDILKVNDELSDEDRDQFFKLIDAGGKRLLRIINDIIDISRIDTKQLSIYDENCDLNKLIDVIQGQFSIPVSEKGLLLTSSKGLPDNKSSITADPTRLAQILSNLLENACKFTDSGTIDFGYKLDGGILAFHVRDEGCGISSNEHDTIFRRFRQSDGNKLKAGSGLGLAIVKELIDLMDGDIRVESETGKGATFYFNIPYRPHNEVSSTPPQKRQVKVGNKFTVLIAEDEPANFLYLKALLKKYNCKILHAQNGVKALDTIKKHTVDLILMDVRMPEMDGLEATREIRKRSMDIPIIGQSAFVLPEDINAGYDSGMNDYLNKPILTDDLENIIEKYIKTNAA